MGLFASRNEKQVKKLKKIADLIEALSDKFSAMSDDELKGMTEQFKERLKAGETLDGLLPEAFATVREASTRVLGLRHFYVQLLGGIALHQGRIAEMCTGEGKTLVATLPVYLNALTGKGMHVVTVNEYLASRDSEWMGKLYKFLGLSVGVIYSGMGFEEKTNAYSCDIVYGTSNEFGFDYLRDNTAKKAEHKVQRGYNFALVDEVDSILIDEARTPLIISDHGGKPTALYTDADKFVKTLTESDYIIEEKEKTVRLSDEGVEKAEKYFKIDNLSDFENSDINDHIYQALRANFIMKRDVNYIVRDKKIFIVDEFTGRIMDGRRFSEGLHQAIEAKEKVPILAESRTIATTTIQNYFRMYNKLSGMTGTAKTEEDEFEGIYGLDVVTIPTNKPQARIDEPDVIVMNQKKKLELIIEDVKKAHEIGQPVLIGTSSVEKNEELSSALSRHGLKHNVLNAKNHASEAEVIAQAGRIGSITLATNMAGRGTDIMLGGNPAFLAEEQMKKEGFEHEQIAVASSIMPLSDEEDLKARARYNELYEIYKEKTAKEKEKVIERGGLRIIGTERHESRRIDNQLRGRSGRQGDPGSSVFYVSVDDELLQRFGGDVFRKVLTFMRVKEDDVIASPLIAKQIESIQRRVEGHNYSMRKNVLSYDDVVNKQRKIIYEERDKILFGEGAHELLTGILDEYIENTVKDILAHIPDDVDKINHALERMILEQGDDLVDEELLSEGVDSVHQAVKERAYELLDEKKQEMEEDGYSFEAFEKDVLLYAIDRNWCNHVDAMDSLKKGIGLRAYGQHNPIIAYTQEGTDMFNDMMDRIKRESASFWLKAKYNSKKLRESGPVMVRNSSGSVQAKSQKTVGRNDPCPCGSGLKYKKCCGKNS